MKSLLILTTLSIGLSMTACLPAPEAASQSSGDSSTETRTRDPVAVDCRVLGYTSLRSLLYEALEIPSNAVLFNGVTLEQHLIASKTALGGEGIAEVRDCSMTYVKAVSQLAIYACHWIAEKNLTALFPQSTSDVSSAYQRLTGMNPDRSEIAALQKLAESIISFDTQAFESLQSKRATAVCTAILTSMATQTI